MKDEVAELIHEVYPSAQVARVAGQSLVLKVLLTLRFAFDEREFKGKGPREIVDLITQRAVAEAMRVVGEKP